ncbi:S8 family serine peptidase [Ferruginibacter sp.]
MKLKFYLPGVLLCMLLPFVSNSLKAQVSPKLVHDIELIMGEKAARTADQLKIDSRLLQALRESRGQKMVDGVDLEPVTLEKDDNGRIKVDISATITPELLSRIEALGGTIIYPSAVYRTVRVSISFAMVESIAAFADVQFIAPAAQASTVSAQNKKQALQLISPADIPAEVSYNTACAKAFSIIPQLSFQQRAEKVRRQLSNYINSKAANGFFTGSVNSQGDRAHRADDTRTTYGYEGQGIRIGLLSDSYNSKGAVASDMVNGNLPGPGNSAGNNTPVTVLADYQPGSDEGRAMLQIVHDVAPQAKLYFATAFISEASFASNIQALRNSPYNCDIIIDDIFYYDEPVFQDGIVAQAVNTVTAAGALYFSSAGNEGSLGKSTAGYFEGDFADAGSPVFTHPTGKTGTIHNFGTVGSPVNGDIITTVGNVYTLNWSDAAGASANDYDLFVVSSAGTVKAQSTNTQSGSQNPYEQISAPALVSGDRLVVFKTGTAAVRAFAINTNRGVLTVKSTGQTHGHSSAVDAFSVAATPAVAPGPYPGNFTASNTVESFSSDGPRRVFYTAAGAAITPGNLLFGTNGGTVRNKPDITAADGVSTTLAATSGLNPFYGTSAAAPHAGAIAALLKSANPSLTPTQIRTTLVNSALDIETAGYDNLSGSGIVQAFQAMQLVAPTPIANIHFGTITVSEGTTGTNGNGYIEPKENGKIVVQLTNPSSVSATAINATLTTSTSGVTVIQNASSYGTIASAANGSNSATPFTFVVNNSVSCGTVIRFQLSVTYSGGGPSPQLLDIDVPVGNTSGINISSTLGSVPPTGAGYTVTSGQQTGRLTRTNATSSCLIPKTNPGLTTAVGSRQYDAYTINNTGASQCINVTMNAANGANLYCVAYTSAGFVPASPSNNYLADPGSSSTSQQFNFTAPPGNFTVVVHDINVTPASNSPYTLNITIAACAAVLPLTWLDFTATLSNNNQVALNWKIANELNVKEYEVEYSTDGINFTSLFTVPATAVIASEKNYSKIHAFPVDGINYYRVKQVDMDGRYSYSKTASVKVNNPNSITIKPNPASSFAVIQSSSVIKRIQLYSSTGQLMLSVIPSTVSYELPLQNLASGQYIIKIETKDGVTNKKLTKN